ncbi:MAG: hypothetical protein DRP08_06955 [Candidatus Aenigmatarchaeota archaeon]|nr:MAG: hypothetical protein DRP08_06955 [Candidatus Aenigmarchaeota archaeon]
METFDYKKRFDYLYLPGMVIAYADRDSFASFYGTIEATSYNYVKLTTGKLVNKGLIFAMLSKEKQEVKHAV